MPSNLGIRAACEYCHRRKIRCIVPPKSNACHNCAATGLLCYFAPRQRPGRPRRATSNPLPPPTSGRSTPSEHTDNAFDTSTCGKDHVEFHSKMQSPQDQPQWRRYATPEHLTATRSSGSPAPSSIGLTGQLDICFDDGLTPLKSIEDVEGLDFQAILKLCSEIDQRSRSLSDVPTITDAESHVEVLDAVCKASITTQSNCDSAHREMVLALLYKALEICHVLVEVCFRSSSDISQQVALRRLLLLRKIDIVAMFFRICFAQMGYAHAGAVLEADELHGKIEHFVRLNYWNWAW
jgi:hypothetical protein